ncbi:MAG: polysaccharide deacetylase family protein [Clostridia bacterium]|nr:polysaccharide deacetylase family protein [Clostridia bacterium]
MHNIHYNFLRFPEGKPKAVTLSYDDGAYTDVRLIETLDKYGLKCTLNIIGNDVANGKGLTLDYLKNSVLAKGHEIATHGYMHRANDSIRSIEGIRETLDTRIVLENALGRIVRGMAYPDRSVDKSTQPAIYENVKTYLSMLDIAYARMAGGNGSFELPEDWLNWMPTAHHENPKLFELIRSFNETDLNRIYCSNRSPKIFFLWGHSFEFERNQNWDRLEKICTELSGKEDVWYATNMEIHDYVECYRSLIYSADGQRIYNPTLKDIWFDIDGALRIIRSDETITL